MNEILKPKERSKLRLLLGKEYYILKRRINWLVSRKKWARIQQNKTDINNVVFKHNSLILRPLKEVDMYLQQNKETNLRLAIQHIDGVIINPYETFSLWKLVGRPTAEKGYLEGLVLNKGKIEKGIGGGLCQLGNLLFWIFAHSPLEITERHRHSYDVFPDINRKVPFGAGATLSYNYIDLQVYNPTSYQFKIKLWIENGNLNGILFCNEVLNRKYKLEERNHQIKQQYWGGYSRHNQIFQLIEEENELVEEKLLFENHALMMYNPFITYSENS